MDCVVIVVEGAEVKPVITISTSATILELKQMIEHYIHVEIARQTLWFGTMELKDSIVIYQYGFKDIDYVRLGVQPLPSNAKVIVSVSADALGYDLQFRMKETDNVLKLKKKISESLDFTPEDTALSYLGVEMIDDYQLSKYYIHEGCKVNLRTPMLC